MMRNRFLKIPNLLKNRWFLLRSTILLGAALLLFGIWAVTLSRLEHERQLVVEHAKVSQRNLAEIISQNLQRLLDSSIQYVQILENRTYAGNPGSVPNLSLLIGGDRAFNRAAFFDARAKRLDSTSADQLSPDLLQEIKHLTKKVNEAGYSNMVIGLPSGAPEDIWQVPLLLTVGSVGNRNFGVLVLHLDLGYLLQQYRDIEIGRSGLIRILKQDGIELARARAGGLEINRTDKNSNDVNQTVKTGTRISTLSNDGRIYLSNLNLVKAYPLAVDVGQEMDEILLDFHSRQQKYVITLFLLSAVIVLMTIAFISALWRQKGYIETILSSERERHVLIEQLELEKLHALELASNDHLTGLHNRRMFMSLAESHLARAVRSRKHYALAFLDLDRFKAINDSLGHHVGDLLLQGVSGRLQKHLRQSDVIARLGGDEFIVLITEVENEKDIVEVTHKLVEIIGKPFADLDGHEVHVSPSIGVAVFPRDADDLDTLIRHADLAMYQSKRAGRGCCTYFDAAMNKHESSVTFDIEQKLARAVETNQFRLHYQPKLDLRTHRVSGFEALIRWEHPTQGHVFPNDFIPLAEKTGHILEIGNWVIAAACRQLHEWQAEGLTPLPIAINLSGRQFLDKSLPERLVGHLNEFGLDPGLLQVEVTESSLIERIEEAGSMLAKIRSAGIKIALDDFGNGFSSLGYIKTLPIDVVKIDRGFVHDILNSHDDSVIVLSTITLAHNLGMRVIAEGVETRAQLVHLKTGGCDEIQGYFLARPLPADEAREWILNPTRENL
jgi:diguanylate cyclase (GGDEF)-like protein